MAALVAEFFRAVSFAPGERPAYQAIFGLFIERGLLIRNTGDRPEISTVDEFVTSRTELFSSGRLTSFAEAELEGVTEHFGGIAHRLSTYTKRGVSDGVAFEARGVISTQFIRTPEGWRMTSMAWDDERPSA